MSGKPYVEAIRKLGRREYVVFEVIALPIILLGLVGVALYRSTLSNGRFACSSLV